jgi:hypothetical protein
VDEEELIGQTIDVFIIIVCTRGTGETEMKWQGDAAAQARLTALSPKHSTTPFHPSHLTPCPSLALPQIQRNNTRL